MNLPANAPEAMLPKGVKDFLPIKAARIEHLQRVLHKVFTQWGFCPIIPPSLEFLHVLERGLGKGLWERTFRFDDRQSGRLLAFPPDITPQVARVVATRLREAPLPLRLSYSGRVLRHAEQQAGKDREIFQAGVEMIGLQSPEADDVFGARVTAQSPTDLNYSQYRGDPGNTGVKPSDLSPVGIESVEKYHEGETINRPPVTSNSGFVAGPGTDGMYIVNLNTGEEMTLPATGETSFPIFDNAGHIIYGDTEKTRKADLETGSIKAEIPGTNRSTIKKYDGKGYRTESGGIGEFNISDLENESLEEFDESPSDGTIAILDNGNKLVANQGSQLVLYDIPNQERLNEIDGAAVSEVSADDQFIYGTSGGELFVWDHNLNEKASTNKPGITQTPPIPSNEDDGRIIYNVEDVRNGEVAAYKINSGSLDKKWSKEVEGTAGETSLFGDTFFVSGSKGLIGLNKENGEELFSESFSAGGRVGMPYQEIIPVSSNDGYRILSVNLDQVSGPEAGLEHEFRDFPEGDETVIQGQTEELDHWVSEVNGVPLEASIEYVLDPEDTGSGEPERTIEVPFSVNANGEFTVDIGFTPETPDKEYSEEVDGYDVDVVFPLEVNGERGMNFEATPYDDETGSTRLL